MLSRKGVYQITVSLCLCKGPINDNVSVTTIILETIYIVFEFTSSYMIPMQHGVSIVEEGVLYNHLVGVYDIEGIVIQIAAQDSILDVIRAIDGDTTTPGVHTSKYSGSPVY
eukprot:m.114916 g.114916  ORF g.114916 m.114916 type:complete len:112 (+) comp14182_c0_seq10:24-359(+)